MTDMGEKALFLLPPFLAPRRGYKKSGKRSWAQSFYSSKYCTKTAFDTQKALFFSDFNILSSSRGGARVSPLLEQKCPLTFFSGLPVLNFPCWTHQVSLETLEKEKRREKRPFLPPSPLLSAPKKRGNGNGISTRIWPPLSTHPPFLGTMRSGGGGQKIGKTGVGLPLRRFPYF